jgi:hypothetical protein
MTDRKVTVITPTIGKPEFARALATVYMNDDADHMFVVDGRDYERAVTKIRCDALSQYHDGTGEWSRIENYGEFRRTDGIEKAQKVKQVVIADNVGANGFYGHRIYAAFPHLVNTQYIMFLDEDNWYKPNHIDIMLQTMENNPSLDFAYSLRSIYDAQGNYLLDDNCESLGKWPTWTSSQRIEPEYLIDTSSFIFKTQFLVQTAHLWHSGWGGDRRYLALIKKFANPKFECTGKHTLAYRLDGNPNSVKKEFFEHGNQYMKSIYGDNLPWIK